MEKITPFAHFLATFFTTNLEILLNQSLIFRQRKYAVKSHNFIEFIKVD